jgi:hypothetical protein
VVTVTRRLGLLKLNFDLGCHFVLRPTIIVQLVQRTFRSQAISLWNDWK